MGAGERRDLRGVEREPRAYLRRWAQEAGGADVAGSDQWFVNTLKCIHAMCEQDAPSAPHEAIDTETMMHAGYIIFLPTLQFRGASIQAGGGFIVAFGRVGRERPGRGVCAAAQQQRGRGGGGGGTADDMTRGLAGMRQLRRRRG